MSPPTSTPLAAYVTKTKHKKFSIYLKLQYKSSMISIVHSYWKIIQHVCSVNASTSQIIKHSLIKIQEF